MRGLSQFIVVLSVLYIIGCKSGDPQNIALNHSLDAPFGDHLIQSLTPEYPNTDVPLSDQQFDSGPLQNFSFSDPDNFVRMTLDQCIDSALRSSQVIRELGGTVLQSPGLITTEDDPALAYTDPLAGEEAALSAFDATFGNQFLYQNNDRAFNSSFIGDQGIFRQDVATNTTTLRKRSATGAQYELSHQILFDRNNTPANRFTNDSSYDTFLAAEIRQPLLQGSGVLFNRIAGPNNLPGVNNGVLIARTNTDITLADFELGVRDLIADVENAYWDLYFAYRNLEANIESRDGAYRIWKNLEAVYQGQDPPTELIQAEEQYYLFASQVENSIHGQLIDGTRTNNGSSSGTFQATSGVRTAERRLRLLIGYVLNDQQLIVPQDQPIDAKVVFDWQQVKAEALSQRTELRRQRWVIKREQLASLANKRNLLPQLDLVGRYRFRGFGNDLFGNGGFDPGTPPGTNVQDDTDAFATFLNGDFQEWELGVDFNVPIGYRRQLSAVRNSELRLMRETKILREQEREIIFGLSNAMGEVERSSKLLEVNTRRLDASKRQFRSIQEAYRGDDTTIDLVLESQRRVITAKLDYFQAQVEFMLAVRSVHFEKGTALQYHNVSLTEKGWANSEYDQAAQRESNKGRPLSYSIPGIKVSSSTQSAPLSFGTTAPISTFEDSGNGPLMVPEMTSQPEQAELFEQPTAKRTANEFFDDSVLSQLALKIKENDEEKAETKKKGSRFSFFKTAKKSKPKSSPSTLTNLEKQTSESPAQSQSKSTSPNDNSWLMNNLPPLKKLKPTWADESTNQQGELSTRRRWRPDNSRSATQQRQLPEQQAVQTYVLSDDGTTTPVQPTTSFK